MCIRMLATQNAAHIINAIQGYFEHRYRTKLSCLYKKRGERERDIIVISVSCTLLPFISVCSFAKMSNHRKSPTMFLTYMLTQIMRRFGKKSSAGRAKIKVREETHTSCCASLMKISRNGANCGKGKGEWFFGLSSFQIILFLYFLLLQKFIGTDRKAMGIVPSPFARFRDA